MSRRAVAVPVGVVVVVIGAVVGIALGVQGQAPSAAGPPPLGNPADFGTGLQCSPGKTLANGFYPLENHSDKTVTITSVRLVGGPGQAMTSAAYLVPVGPNGIIGLYGPWPPTAPVWRQRRLAVGGTVAAHSTANLVFAQTRTSDHPKPAAPKITYRAGGASYTLTEPIKTIVAVSCQAH